MPLFGGPPDVAKLNAKSDVKGLTKALGYQKDAGVRKAAAEALGRVGDAAAIGPLITALGDPPVHETAVDGLVRLHKYSVEPLIAALTDGSPEVRAGAASALGSIGDARAVAFLLNGLFDTAADVRRVTVIALCQFGDTRTAGSVGHALGDRDPKVRCVAAGWLWKFGAGLWAEPLAAALADPDQEVRQAAFWSLARIGDPRAVEGLIGILRAPAGSRGSYDAVEALGRSGDPRAVEPLIAKLASGDRHLRWDAAEALVAIYQAGKLDEASKARVLAQRDAMTHFHSDYDTGCVGDGSHEHTDEGIGVDSPADPATRPVLPRSWPGEV